MGITERIQDIEAEMARTQKNKATEGHLGRLKAQLAKLRTQLIEAAIGPSGTGEGFDVRSSGDARTCLIGFPSVGKSTLLSKLTKTKSVAAAYEFTTLTVIPGKIEYNGASIQLLDTPGIIEDASKGVGRGRQVISVTRQSDLVIMMLDAQKGAYQRQKLTEEMEAVGIRLNQRKPHMTYVAKQTGGVKFTATCRLTKTSEATIRSILQQYRIHNCEIVIRDDLSIDEVIDVIQGNRVYLRCLYVYNKVDSMTIEEVDAMAREPNSVVISCHWDLNLDYLVERIWYGLELIRIYTKPRGQGPEFTEPLILRKGSTVEQACRSLHRDLVKEFKYAAVWGRSTKHNPQRVGLAHELTDEDVLQIMKK